MLQFLVIFITILRCVVFIRGEHCDCPPNEEYTWDPICPPDTCSARNKDYNCCDATSPPYKTGCKCISGYYRLHENGPCVPACECPKKPYCCPDNEEYTSEPICPPDTCSAITAKYDCRNATSPPFKSGCKCKGGYLRLKKNGPCVSACKCPQNANLCPENEECVQAPFCPPDSCFSISAFYDCRNVVADTIGCKCINGYKRLDNTGVCVPIDQC